MGWVEALTGNVVGLDTAPLIYYVEANPTYVPLADPFVSALVRGEIEAITSIVTLIETTVQPMRRGGADLTARYQDLLLDTEHIATVDLSAAKVQDAARLRAIYNLRTPDAIQLATAIQAGAGAFLTGEAILRRFLEACDGAVAQVTAS